MAESSFAQRDSTADALADASAMRSVYDDVDWSSTALGPPDSWPALLRLLVDLCLDSEFPVQIGWGPDAVTIDGNTLAIVWFSRTQPCDAGSSGTLSAPCTAIP